MCRKTVHAITAFVIGVILLFLISCAKPPNQEMPLTTTSSEARQLLLSGREAWDDLRLDEARRLFEKAIALDSNFAIAYLYTALTEFGNDAFFIYMRKGVSLSNSVSEGEKELLLAAEADYLLQIIPLAITHAQKLADAYPRDKRAREWCGFWFWRAREYEKAIEELTAAVQIDPRFGPAYNMMGYCYSALGKFDDAEESLQKYAELLPNNPNPLDSYGEILLKQGKYDASIEAYNKALSLDPKYLSARIGLGTNLVLQGKEEEGRDQFRRYCDNATDDDQRRNGLRSIADSYIFQSDYPKALQELQKSYDLASKADKTFDMASDLSAMAEILLESGHLEEAKSKRRASLDLVQESSLATKEVKDRVQQGYHRFLVYAALKAGDLKAARENEQEYRNATKGVVEALTVMQHHELTGAIALYEKRFDDALRELRETDLQDPRNLFRLATAYEAQGDRAKAREFWMKSASFNEIRTDFAFVRNKALAKLAANAR
jgi:tetratricopeptide (TPR) repeat protein